MIDPPNKVDKSNRAGRTLISLWSVLRLTSIPVATLAFIYDKKNEVHFSVGTYLLDPWYRYDAKYYVQIVSHGYQGGDITSGFHPLFPWLAKLVDILVHQPLLSLMIVSSAAGLLLTISFYRLVTLDNGHVTALTATGLLLYWPVAACLFFPYTEALFMLLSVWCVLAARQGKFWLSGLSGCLASLTRQHGIFLALPIVWELWEASNRDWRHLVTQWRRVSAVLLIPFGYLAWILYRGLAINDVHPDISSPQRFIYSVLISPKHYQVFPTQQFLPPWIALWKATKILWLNNLHWSSYGDAFMAILFIAMFLYGWRHMRTSYWLYSLAVILAGLSLHTGSAVNPYTSLPRHLFLAFPVFIGVAKNYQFRRLPFILTILGLCQLLILCCYVWQTWVP